MFEDPLRNFLKSHFGITHCSSGIVIDTTEISLTVDQRIAQREILSHADHGFVYGVITVRMIFPDNLSHHTGGFYGGMLVENS